MNQKTWAAGVVSFFLGALSMGCQSGGIGDPCLPEDEYQLYFSGYSVTELNLESRSFQCETRLCLVNHFQGRVSCPYGQDTTMAKPDYQKCHIPGTTGDDTVIQVDVKKQYTKRQRNEAVYCSCRCAGDDPEGRYCKCPTGYQCEHLLDYVGPELGGKELAGSYCIKDGTSYKESETDVGESCTVLDEDADPPGNCGKWDGSN